MGKIIGLLFFLGGCAVIKALISASTNLFFMVLGVLFIVIALVIFIMELKKISKRETPSWNANQND